MRLHDKERTHMTAHHTDPVTRRAEELYEQGMHHDAARVKAEREAKDRRSRDGLAAFLAQKREG